MPDTLLLNADGSLRSVIPISTVNWQDAIRHIVLDTAIPLHHYEDWVVHSPSVSFVVPSVLMLRKQAKHKTAVRLTRANVFLRDGNLCMYCGGKFPERELTWDHVLPRSHGGTTRWDNIVSACGPCNTKRANNTRIRPKKEPWKPAYYELASKRQTTPVEVPHETWIPYIGWPEDLVRVRNRKHNLSCEPVIKIPVKTKKKK